MDETPPGDGRGQRPHAPGLAASRSAELRLPAEITFIPAEGTGSSSRAVDGPGRRGAGSSATAWHRVGVDQSFSADLSLTDIDVETIGRGSSRPRRSPARARSTAGSRSAAPTRPPQPVSAAGSTSTCDDASIGDIPVIRELEPVPRARRRAAASRTGDLHATIANRQILVDELTLAGPGAPDPRHGRVGFDGGLDLAVLVNTNQIIPQTGQALARRSSRGSARRSAGARRRCSGVANYFSNRLLKFRVGGTVKNPSVALDPGRRRRRGRHRVLLGGAQAAARVRQVRRVAGSDQDRRRVDGAWEASGSPVTVGRPAKAPLRRFWITTLRNSCFASGADLRLRHRDLAGPVRIRLDQPAHQRDEQARLVDLVLEHLLEDRPDGPGQGLPALRVDLDERLDVVLDVGLAVDLAVVARADDQDDPPLELGVAPRARVVEVAEQDVELGRPVDELPGRRRPRCRRSPRSGPGAIWRSCTGEAARSFQRASVMAGSLSRPR